MLKVFFLITALPLVVSCSTTKVPTASKNRLLEQADAYTTKYQTKPYGFPPGIVVSLKGRLKEIVYFDLTNQRLGHSIYKESPLDQFLSIIEKNNSINYQDAKVQITNTLHSYYASDCPSISDFFTKLANTDIEYKESKYALSFDSPTYEYFYKKPKLPISFSITTAIEEHPIAILYRNAMQAIENCPHPKEPKYHKNPTN